MPADGQNPMPTPALPRVVVRRDGAPAAVRPGLVWRVLRVIRVIPLVMLLLLTGGVVGLYFQPPGVRYVMGLLHLDPGGGATNPIAVPAPRAEPTKPATPQPRFVSGLGVLVPDGDVVTIAPPFGAGDARVAELKSDEGDRVARGDLLATLDNRAQFEAVIATARATVASREAALAQTRAGVAASRDEAAAALERARAAADVAQSDFARIETLYKQQYATRASYDQRLAARDQAARDVERAAATLSRFSADTIDTQPDVVVALRALDAAKADLDRATRDLDKSMVRSPMDGTILSVNARAGEKPGQGRLFTIADLAAMTAEIEIYQTDIGKVDIGAAVTVTADALPKPLAGTVTRIGLEVGRQSLIDASPAANTDARVVKVTARLDEASTAIAARFTNLQVAARVTIAEVP